MKKVVIFVGIVLAILLAFLFILTQPTPLVKAIDELVLCSSKDEIENVFNKYKKDLTTTNESLEKELDKDFLREVRKKLSSLNLSDTDIAECQKWLPPAPTSLNLIIVPDLSRRIIDEVNNPSQITNDTVILNYIWKTFENHTKLRTDTKGHLIIDVTDEEQAGGQFRVLANDLIFNMPEHKTPYLRGVWFDSMRNRYLRNIEQLYRMAKEKPIGADYWFYFKYELSKHVRKSTLYNNYRNILIIITDGYLEAENPTEAGIWDYTGSLQKRNIVVERLKYGNSIEDALNGLIRIPDINQKFPTLEILLLEVNKRKKSSYQEKDHGTNYDYVILKFLWTDWFNRLGIKNANKDFFFLRNKGTDQTKEIIDNFLDSK
jgi:hypothetical protein